MKVVAFMQNMWVRDPERVRQMIARHGEPYRLRVIEYSLFAGCVSGRRLKSAFGDLTEEIVWEESTREIGGEAKSSFPPDLDHIRAVLKIYEPGVVLTFGIIAGDAVASVWQGKLIRAPHPSARQPDTAARLKAAAEELQAVRNGCH